MSRKSEAIKLSELQSQRELMRSLEPLLVIGGGVLLFGAMENVEIDGRYWLSRAQKWALMTGLVSIEVARSGLIGQVSEAATSAAGVVTSASQSGADAVGKLAPLLLAAG